jgi:paraquat-inducible protein A
MAIACPDCGTLQDLPTLEFGATAVCPTCDNRLERTRGRSVAAAFACAVTTLIMLVPANVLPLMDVRMLGAHRESHLGSGVLALWAHQWVIVAGLVGAFAVVLPFFRFGLLTVVLGSVLLRLKPRWLGRTFRWTQQLDLWAMPDVFLIGCAVGYSRIAANLPVHVEAGGVCFIVAAFGCMLSRASLDRRTVWRAIGGEQAVPSEDTPTVACPVCDLVLPSDAEGSPCPRCALELNARRPDAIVTTIALVIAGFALYLPANIYPMSIAMQMGKPVSHRIIDGVRELVRAGLWPLAILITCTSIAIPLLKLLGLSWLAVSVQRRSRRHLVLKTKLYRMIDEVGRWSNVDVFTIAVFLPLLQFGSFVSTRAGIGAPSFILVVFLTMIASRVFDPRLLWDAGLGDAP